MNLETAPTKPFEPTPAHASFAHLSGDWRGTTSIWLEPGKPAEEVTTEVRAAVIAGGRFLRLESTGTAMGHPHAGEMLLAFEKDTSTWTLAQVDSFHTGTAMIVSTGTKPEIDVVGSYVAGPERWGWRTILKPGQDELVIDAYNIEPNGTEHHAIHTTLRRA